MRFSIFLCLSSWLAPLLVSDLSLFAKEEGGAPVLSAAERRAFIRTPPSPVAPRINGPRVQAARPGKPFILLIPATGSRPMRFSARDLPAGLSLDETTGVITGRVPARAGSYPIRLGASNAHGTTEVTLELVVGERLALTPPMGWNNYNAFRLKIDQALIQAQASALVTSGLSQHGWNYVNVDDGWSGPRSSDGTLKGNSRFPDMAALGAHIHGLGLRFGLYSSPGTETCGGYPGSLGHEAEDARSYAAWGVDFLKYDWCSYQADAARLAAARHGALLPAQAERLRALAEEYIPLQADRRRPRPEEMAKRMREIEAERKTLLAPLSAEVRLGIDTEIATGAYRRMGQALAMQDRDIVYSLCQYGESKVWKWGPEVGASLWRTTRDITPNYPRMLGIIRQQAGLEAWAGPGRWNDPDMLEIGNGKLSPDEMHMQMTQWCILAAPLLLGTDLTRMDELVLSILCNDEVIAVNQDALGRQGKCVKTSGAGEIWTKEQADGSLAVGVFNRGDEPMEISFSATELGLAGRWGARDLWRQRDLPNAERVSFVVGAHGAELVLLRRGAKAR